LILLIEPNRVDPKIGDSDFQKCIDWSKQGLSGGPSIVAENLLKELRQRQDLAWTVVTPETSFDKPYSILWVVNNLSHLSWAIEHRTVLGVKELWAGPNLIVVPHEAEGIIGHPAIDKVIVPCSWVADKYATLMPDLKNKLELWPVGIDTNDWQPDCTTRRDQIVIYDKFNTAMANDIQNGLLLLGEKITRVTYANYQHSAYKELLNSAKLLIWLSSFESQGIALLEALAMNVPTLCLGNTVWHYISPYLQQEFVYHGSTSAPYFSKQCGLFFDNTEDFFTRQYSSFCRQLNDFTPRAYLFDNYLTVGQSLQRLLPPAALE